MKDKIRITGPPDPPAGRPSVRTFNSTATIAWSSPPYDGGCMVTGYRVEMKKLPQTSWTVVTDRCHSLSHTVHDLVPGIEYVFRVRAENVHGASEASAETSSISIGSKSSSGSEEDDVVAEPKTWDRVKVEPGQVFSSRYEIMEELGKGRYGVVHKVLDRTTSQKMAAKFVRCIKKQDKQKVFEEIEIMNCLRHPKLLQLVSAYDNTREIVMVTEYITGGELFERVVADDFTLTERDCMLFMRQICEGVDYMHQNSVVHLDLKPENIMCYTRTSHQIKIIDFGLAQKLSPSITLRVLFGTPEFIPPEIINYEPIGVESDMWSVGVICYVLLSGLSPFMGDNDAETFANITRADFDFDDEAFDAISQDVKDLISNLLVKRKEKRFSARQCLEHKWMSQCDKTMSCVKLSTDKLKKFIIRRKWQKTGNAIRALGRMATLSAASRRNSATTSQSSSPRQSLAGGGVSRMSSLNEEEQHNHVSTNEEIYQQHNISAECNGKNSRVRVCSERSDSGISDCSSINAPTSQQIPGCQTLTDKAFSISEENELCDVGEVIRSNGQTNDKSELSPEKNESKITRFRNDEKSRTLRESTPKLRFDTTTKQVDQKEATRTRFADNLKPSLDEASFKGAHQLKEATRTRFAENLKPTLDEAAFQGSLGRNKVDVENNRRNDSKRSVSGFVSTNKRLEDMEKMKVSSSKSKEKISVVSSLKETSSGLPTRKSTNSVVSSSPFLSNSFLTDEKTKRTDESKFVDNFSDSDACRSSSLQAGGLKVTTDARARSLSPALQRDAKVLEKSENFQKAFAFWKR